MKKNNTETRKSSRNGQEAQNIRGMNFFPRYIELTTSWIAASNPRCIGSKGQGENISILGKNQIISFVYFHGFAKIEEVNFNIAY